MPKFSFSVPFTMPREDAKSRIRSYMEKMREYFAKQFSEVQEDWNAWDAEHRYGFAFTTMGLTISGAMIVDDAAVRFEGELPFAAVMFKGKMEQNFREMVEKALTA